MHVCIYKFVSIVCDMGKESTEYNGLNAISATEKKSKTLNTNYNPNTPPFCCSPQKNQLIYTNMNVGSIYGD